MDVNSPSSDVTVTITRPSNTTTYGAGDAVGQADVSVAANAGDAILVFGNVPQRAVIEGATLRVDLSSVTASMAAFRLHLYSSQPTAILDNAAWDLVAGDRTKYLGYIEFATPTDMGATLWSQLDQVNKRVASAGGNLYGILTTQGAYTPASGEVLAVTLRVVAV